MRKHTGKIIVSTIAGFLLLLVLGIQEFRYGMIQKAIYTYKVKHYLEQKYNEPMTIKHATYLWDNMEPISARVYPKSSIGLEFSVYPRKENPLRFIDDYASTLWLQQAKEDVDKRLLTVEDDFRNQLHLAFTCCEVGKYDFGSIYGDVPPYTTANLAFDLSFQFDREMQKTDLEQMLRVVTALKQQEQPLLDHVLFLLLPEGKPYRIQYQIPGSALKEINKIDDLKAYNQSRFPARDLAASIGAEVSWDAATSQAVFTKGDVTLQINHWGEEALINGSPVLSPLPSFPGDQGQLLVPAALIEQAFQVEVPLVGPF
ncbi:copper amine oxidase N-terminal domain-containing protein [Paenibacillus eucommiae]|uniref:Copper amine oxidase-like N-terminal domain-containing protein n=1 Tax=Paenibacillus eucommiae TaxID=1355755 RepID=A0ABS4J2K7_9BACL|nr:copper amine oxidase N-terminal domain-containing protein [Paenibacillus eucommiae]MBP1994018.1 hypothetical protein [Paenibacillus eucommiae]